MKSSHDDGCLRTALLSPTTTLRVLGAAADKHSEEVFLDFAGETWTYDQFCSQVDRYSTALADHGVRAGDTVVGVLDNSVDIALLWFAVNQIGAIWVPLNAALKGEYLRHQVVDSQAKVAIVEGGYRAHFQDIAARLPELERLIIRGEIEPTDRQPAIAEYSLDEFALADAQRKDHPVKPDDLSCIVYTAGTTGPSKGCMISHNYICAQTNAMNIAIGRRSDEVHWTPLPLFHVNAMGVVLGSALVGGRGSIYPRFSLSRFWPEIRRSEARVVNILGSMITLIAKAEESKDAEACVGQIRVVCGAPFSAEMISIWKTRFGVSVAGAPGYGTTEAGPTTATLLEAAKRGTSGRRHELFDVEVVNEEDVPQPPGAVGEIVVRPRYPNVMFSGYWQRPESTLAVTKNLWFHTGDLGRFDENGWFYFVDRKKDYLRRRGENISSVEVETTFLSHPAVKEVAIHAVPSVLSEDDVKATIVLHEGTRLTASELSRWAMDELPSFALPRYIEFREVLPKNEVGRVLKYQLRQEGKTAATWDREQAAQ